MVIFGVEKRIQKEILTNRSGKNEDFASVTMTFRPKIFLFLIGVGRVRPYLELLTH